MACHKWYFLTRERGSAIDLKGFLRICWWIRMNCMDGGRHWTDGNGGEIWFGSRSKVNLLNLYFPKQYWPETQPSFKSDTCDTISQPSNVYKDAFCYGKVCTYKHVYWDSFALKSWWFFSWGLFANWWGNLETRYWEKAKLTDSWETHVFPPWIREGDNGVLDGGCLNFPQPVASPT